MSRGFCSWFIFPTGTVYWLTPRQTDALPQPVERATKGVAELGGFLVSVKGEWTGVTSAWLARAERDAITPNEAHRMEEYADLPMRGPPGHGITLAQLDTHGVRMFKEPSGSWSTDLPWGGAVNVTELTFYPGRDRADTVLFPTPVHIKKGNP
jgi:hypothetical protein